MKAARLGSLGIDALMLRNLNPRKPTLVIREKETRRAHIPMPCTEGLRRGLVLRGCELAR